jgi:hypothetical protein
LSSHQVSGRAATARRRLTGLSGETDPAGCQPQS